MVLPTGRNEIGLPPVVPFVYASTTEGPVLVVGVAHVVDLEAPLRELLGARTLDGIALELDAERAAALLEDSPPPRPSGGPAFARLWSMVQRRLGDQIGGGPPGGEMRTAARIARERGLPVFLIDDPIRATLVELVRTMPLKERVQLFVGAFLGLFVPARVVEREMDRYAGEPEAYTAELRRASPTLAHVLLDERNEHMAERLRVLRTRGYGRLAVVVGDAHRSGLGTALNRRGIPVESVAFRDLRSATASASGPG
jgi:pheromone shutdown protein TraB